MVEGVQGVYGAASYVYALAGCGLAEHEVMMIDMGRGRKTYTYAYEDSPRNGFSLSGKGNYNFFGDVRAQFRLHPNRSTSLPSHDKARLSRYHCLRTFDPLRAMMEAFLLEMLAGLRLLGSNQ